MKTIVLAAEKSFSKDATQKIETLAATFPDIKLKLVQAYKSRDELTSAVADADALIVRSDKVDEALLNAAPNLRVVARAGAGYDTINVAACTSRKIVVMNTPGQNSNAVAELAFGQIIFVLRHGYTGKSGTELKGRKLGLHAFGAVARNVARIAQGFGMEVCAYDPFVKQEDLTAYGVKHVTDLKELYSSCSIVSIHTPLTPETRGCVSQALLEAMPGNTPVLVNTARAEVVDEEALKAVMAKRPGFGYAADVAPKCAAELREKYADRVCLSTVKSGAQTEEANANCGTAAVSQIARFFQNGDATFQVNKF